MAEIKPLRAWRYNSKLSEKIGKLTSPLFDVVSERQLKYLYKNKLNSIHLSVPAQPDPSTAAKQTLDKWKSDGTIVQDPIPGIYVYYQYFTLPGESVPYCRKGFVCNIRIYDWKENVILRHEDTMPAAVNERIDILKSTELNASPTHGLYTDKSCVLEGFMDESMKHPIYDTEDYQGVRDVLSVIHDVNIIGKFIEVLKDKPVILADGHHRYEGSLVYRDLKSSENEGHTGNEGYNYHFMYLTNTETHDFRILPTHRLISGLQELSEFRILKALEKDFTITSCENSFDLDTVLLGKHKTFGLLFKENAYVLKLRIEVSGSNPWKIPEIIKNLDISIMHYFIIEKVLGIRKEDQRNSKNISYDRNFADCITKVLTGKSQIAIFTNEVTMDQVKEVCYSGYTMPQKTTFFYPKAICGFLFSSIKDDEFTLPIDFSLK